MARHDYPWDVSELEECTAMSACSEACPAMEKHLQSAVREPRFVQTDDGGSILALALHCETPFSQLTLCTSRQTIPSQMSFWQLRRSQSCHLTVPMRFTCMRTISLVLSFVRLRSTLESASLHEADLWTVLTGLQRDPVSTMDPSLIERSLMQV